MSRYSQPSSARCHTTTTFSARLRACSHSRQLTAGRPLPGPAPGSPCGSAGASIGLLGSACSAPSTVPGALCSAGARALGHSPRAPACAAPYRAPASPAAGLQGERLQSVRSQGAQHQAASGFEAGPGFDPTGLLAWPPPPQLGAGVADAPLPPSPLAGLGAGPGSPGSSPVPAARALLGGGLNPNPGPGAWRGEAFGAGDAGWAAATAAARGAGPGGLHWGGSPPRRASAEDASPYADRACCNYAEPYGGALHALAPASAADSSLGSASAHASYSLADLQRAFGLGRSVERRAVPAERRAECEVGPLSGLDLGLGLSGLGSSVERRAVPAERRAECEVRPLSSAGTCSM